MSTVQRSGVLLVFSRIADPASFSSDTYDDWYNLIHIPDTLNTDGISNAARYRAERDSHEEYPYLALYRVPDMNFLDGKEFGSIAVHHEMLPGPSHSILDVAMFDLRRYIRVHNFVQGNGLRQAIDADICLISLTFDLMQEQDEAHTWMYKNVIEPVAACTEQLNTQVYVRWRSVSGRYGLTSRSEDGTAEYLVLYYSPKKLANTIRCHAPSDAVVSIYIPV